MNSGWLLVGELGRGKIVVLVSVIMSTVYDLLVVVDKCLIQMKVLFYTHSLEG